MVIETRANKGKLLKGWYVMSEKIKISGDTGVAMIPLSPDDLIITDKGVYKIGLLASLKDHPEDVQEGIGYLEGDLFYLYKGEYIPDYSKEPGIYKDGDTLILVHPQTPEQLEEMQYSDKIVVNDIVSVAAMCESGLDDIEYDQCDCGRIFAPALTMQDDILKRAIKMALLVKHLDIDSRRDRFPDKNALFNAKQVIKGNQKLSAMLFDRWCDALNLKYTISLEEIDADKSIGNPLPSPIEIHSNDSFQS